MSAFVLLSMNVHLSLFELFLKSCVQAFRYLRLCEPSVYNHGLCDGLIASGDTSNLDTDLHEEQEGSGSAAS